MEGPLASTEWLAERLGAPDIVVIHAILAFEKTLEELTREYHEARIPGAVLFDIDEVADTNNPLPHMLPPPEKFSSMMKKMGIGDGQRIVVYDTDGNFCASRVWWMFRTFGARDVAVLDGGLPKWLAEGHPTEDGPPVPRQPRHFTSRFQTMGVRDLDDVRAALKTGPDQVLDARSNDRFTAREKESRKELRSGHMPGSFNLHYASLLNDDKTMKSPKELETLFTDAGIDLARPVITTCGSGVTAAILSLALERIGRHNHAVYDGSWVEWGGRDDTEVIEG